MHIIGQMREQSIELTSCELAWFCISKTEASFRMHSDANASHSWGSRTQAVASS